MSDRVSARRATANNYFLALQSGLTAVLAFFSKGLTADSVPLDQVIIGIAATAGVILAIAWWLLLRSYRDLNRAKFIVITKIENTYFDADLRPFADEWASLKTDPVTPFRSRYAELGAIERVIPLAFALLYIALAVRVVLR